ncbi:ectopic P granules protein 5-like protein, partial [Leptotrombidium deliense]
SDSGFYENVNNFKKAREALSKTRTKLSSIKEDSECLQNKVWEIESKTIKKRQRCSDGRLVEGKHTYNEANLNKDVLRNLEKNLQATKNLLSNDYCNNFYTAQISQKDIEAEIQTVITESASEIRTHKLRTLISSLFAFQRIFEEVDSEFVQLVKQWITQLVAVLLQNASYNDRLFLLNHVLRCPGGVSSWTASFVQCRSPLHAIDKQDASSTLNHCLTVISTILSPVKDRDKFVGSNAKHAENPEVRLSADDLWHLVDADVDEGEDVLINKVNLTETDIIRLLQQVPFQDLLEYITERQFIDDDSLTQSLNQVSEYSMLKLLSVSTKMIQILRQGLITFNCMRFRTLTDYITLLIRKTVCAVASSWQNCKRKLTTEDPAMLLRLQVEYDHFVLRSVVAILSSQRFGVWRFVSVIPFNGVTESMMWHILWVFYNNGRDEVDELGGLCPYFSDSYWRSKFNEPAMKYLFQEKLPTLSTSECECLLRSLGNMIKSRDSTEVEFINTVAVEMFEMGFLMCTINDKTVSTCTELFAELALQHPFLISALVFKIRDSNCFNEQCIDLFEKIPLYLWKTDESVLHLLGDWLAKSAFNTIFNRLSRLIICKMNWGYSDDKSELFLSIKFHRLMAILLYEAMYEQIKVSEGLESCNCPVYSGFDAQSFISCAKLETRKGFVEFCWRTALTLKLYLHDQPNWRKIPFREFENSESVEFGFYPLPNINTDCELLSIFKGLEAQNPYAIYFTLVMTETGHSVSSFGANVELLSSLITSKNHIPALDILHWFIPFYVDKLEEIMNDAKFVGSLNQLLLSEENGILDKVIGLIESQLKTNIEIKKKLIIFWINILCEISGSVLKQYSSSWFIASSKGLQQVVHLLDGILMLIFGDDTFTNLVTDLLIQKTGEMQSLKLPSTGSWFSWGSNAKKSEWISPLHFLSQKFPDKVWFASALIKSDVIKTEKIWEEILIEMNNNLDMNVETALKNVCTRLLMPVIPMNVLPICAWAKLVLDSSPNHVLLPLIWYNFFTCFFASVGTGASMGLRIIGETLCKKLKLKLHSLIEHFHSLWSKCAEGGDSDNDVPLPNMTRLYRALLSWLEDTHLHDAFVDIERLPAQYCGELLKSVMDNSDSLMKNYINEMSLENEITTYFDAWNLVKHLKLEKVADAKAMPNLGNRLKQKNSRSKYLFTEFANFGDMRPYLPPEYKCTNIKVQQIDDTEILNCKSETILSLLQQHIRLILEENKLAKLSNLSHSLIELITNNYDNVRKTKIACDKDGYDPDGCTGHADFTFEFYEAFENKQNSKQIERNRIDENNLLGEIFDTPSDRAVSVATYLIKSIPLVNIRLFLL